MTNVHISQIFNELFVPLAKTMKKAKNNDNRILLT